MVINLSPPPPPPSPRTMRGQSIKICCTCMVTKDTFLHLTNTGVFRQKPMGCVGVWVVELMGSNKNAVKVMLVRILFTEINRLYHSHLRSISGPWD